MGTSRADSGPCSLTIRLFSGNRQAFPASGRVLVNLRDGSQRQVLRRWVKGPSFRVSKLPFHNNFSDNHTVVAWAEGHRQAGFTPVRVAPEPPASVDLMLLSQDPGFNFSQARWGVIRGLPRYARLLGAGAGSPEAARKRYADLMENRPAALACLLNLLTAMAQIHLPAGSPIDYLRELIWDHTMRQDRFFAWAEPALVEQVVRSAAKGLFKAQPGTAIFHPGATRSYKQAQFGEANLQLTFHENDRRSIGGAECIKVETDMDYFKDPAAHALLEVLVNSLTGSATDPRQVYVLRWMAGRQAGVPEFDPPYTLT